MRAEWAWVLGVAAVAACGGETASRRDTGDVASTGDAADSPPVQAAATTPAPRSETGPRRTIVFLGTSLTAGLGLDPEEAYPALVAQKIDSAGLGYEVVNAGVSGETSAGALQRIDWVLRGPVDVLVLETGANDGLRGLNLKAMERNIQAILDRVRATRPRTRLLLVQMEAPPNMGAEYTARFRSVFPALARRNAVPLVPFLLSEVAGHDTLNQPDGIHPNPAGARVLAETMFRALLPVLASQEAARAADTAASPAGTSPGTAAGRGSAGP